MKSRVDFSVGCDKDLGVLELFNVEIVYVWPVVHDELEGSWMCMFEDFLSPCGKETYCAYNESGTRCWAGSFQILGGFKITGSSSTS